MLETVHARFDQAGLADVLAGMGQAEVDELDFGVIGIDNGCVVRLYNRFESQAAGLSPSRVVGHHFFDVVGQCMNNFMVAQRFEDALERGSALDHTIDYVLTLRMRPVKVKLRMLAPALGASKGQGGSALRYVLVQRAV